jgi:hypothetical protein
MKEIDSFRSSVEKLDALNDEMKKDSMFGDIDHLMASKFRMLYNEFLFCRFAELGNGNYYQQFISKIDAVYSDIKSLNALLPEYMYTLSKTEYENNTQALENIRIRVEAMSEAAAFQMKPTLKQ